MKIIEFTRHLNEAEMNPKTFAAAIKEGGDLGVLVGFEFEICIPKDRVEAWEQQGAAAQASDDSTPVDFGTMTVKGFMQKFTRFTTGSYIDEYFQSVDPIPGTNPSSHKIFDSYSKVSNVTEFKSALNLTLNEAIERVKRSASREFTPPTAEEWQAKLFNKLNENGIDISDDAKIAEFTKDGVRSFGESIIEAAKNIERKYHNEKQATNAEWSTPEFQIPYLNYTFWESIRTGLQNNLRSYQSMTSVPSRDSFAAWTKQTFGSVKMSDLVPTKWKIREGKTQAILNVLIGRHPEYNPNRSRTSSGYSRGAEFVQSVIAPVFGKTNIFNNYHQSTKNLTDWYIEPDGSLNPKGGDFACEVVTPPMPAPEAMENLKKFYALAQDNGFYTGKSNSTGLHINVSIPRDLDVLKLAMFLGDEYVLKAFGREANRYANSIVKSLRGQAPDVDWQGIKDPVDKLKSMASNISRDHFSSVNNTGKYVSFRHAGGDYLKQPEEVVNTVGRFIRAMTIASDPGAYRNEYLTKATKFIKEKETKAIDIRGVLKNIREHGVSVIRESIYFWDRVPSPEELEVVAQRQFGVGFNDVKITDIISGNDDIKQKLVNASGWSSGTKQQLAAADLNRFLEITIVPTSAAGIAAMNRPQTLNKAIGAYLNGSRIGAGVISAQDKLTKDDPNYQEVVKNVIGQASNQLIRDRAARAAQPAPEPTTAASNPVPGDEEGISYDTLGPWSVMDLYTGRMLMGGDEDTRFNELRNEAGSRMSSWSIPRDEIRIIHTTSGQVYDIDGNPATYNNQQSQQSTTPQSDYNQPAPQRPGRTYEIVSAGDSEDTVQRVYGTLQDAASTAMEYVRQGNNVLIWDDEDSTFYNPRDLTPVVNESREYGDPEPIYYFAYGMLTNPSQMQGAEFVGAATLPNFAFEFRGYANVYPHRGVVQGVLWSVSREWLGHLDQVEGYPTLYDRKTVPVYSGGQRYEANLYTMTPATREQLEGKSPSRSYVMRLVKGYNNADIPLRQISQALGADKLSEMNRRGFLGAVGAGAMSAAGVPAQAAPQKPKVVMSYLSSHSAAEEMLHKTALRAGIRGTELAQFLAQCYHESAGFGRMHEYASGAEYEGRRDLGNVNRGDGVKYKGRGFIQITGRDNYRRAGQALGLPLEQQPELASRPDVAAKIAVWYWNNRVKPNVDNFNDTTSVTRFINPKMRGLEDRHENFKDYKNMFNMAKL